MKYILLSVLILLPLGNLFAQSNSEKADSLLMLAIETMDNGNADQAIEMLKTAKKLDPKNFIYDYEIGYAYLLKEDYKNSLKVYKKVVKYKNATDQCYQMLGNLYDYNDMPDLAVQTYNEGLKLFPNSGRLYLEKGNMHWQKKEFQKALPIYEQGIKVDPDYPSNYYRATILYLNSTEKVWGMIYGEIFMNMERNSNRTAEISKLLYDTYKSQIKFRSDTAFSVSFSQSTSISADLLASPESFKLPFGIGAYEPALALAVVGQSKIDLNALDTIRTQFVKNYFAGNLYKDYPNVLFDYQKQVLDLGFLESYNHWILMKGDEEEFDSWYTENTEKWEKFIDWFTVNGLIIDSENKFHSSQY